MRKESILNFRRSQLRFVVSTTGGGAAFIADYLAVPGASRSFLEGRVPYSREASDDFLGFEPESYGSERAARLFASAALRRAVALNRDTAPTSTLQCDLVGVGAAASLASDRPKKGARRAFCSVQTFYGAFAAALNFENAEPSRTREERIVADFIFETLRFAAEMRPNERGETKDEPWRLKETTIDIETEETTNANERPRLRYVLLDEFGADLLYRDDAPLAAMQWREGRVVGRRDANDGAVARGALYPGSFNPPHRGHLGIASIAAKRTGDDTNFELSVRNVDKPPLDPIEIARRASDLAECAPESNLWTTNAPKFIDKTTLFPNATVAVGTDTILRLADPKYADNSVAKRDLVVERIRANGAKFLVFPRKINGETLDMEEIQRALPKRLYDVCEFVEPTEFLDDSSSSALRANARRQDKDQSRK